MAEEKEFSLDEFNFDDLPEEETGNATDTAGFDKASIDDVDLSEFNFDDLSFSDETADDGRKEPFFEASFNEEETANWVAEAETYKSEEEHPFDDVSTQGAEDMGNENMETLDEFAYEEAAAEEYPTEETVSEEYPTEEAVSEEYPVEEAVSEEASTEDFVGTDNAAVNDLSDTQEIVDDRELIVSEISSEEYTQDEVNESAHEAFWRDGNTDDVLPDNGEYLSQNNAVGQQEEYFSSEDNGEFFADEANFANENKSSYVDYHSLPSLFQSGETGNLRWYSAQSDVKMYHIAKGFENGNFVADEECKTLHINVGYDTYGWEVQFSTGMVMNLRDVREYQLRNGRLPSSNGRVVYGNSSLSFSGVARIVIYESVKYFSYGA